MRYFKDTRYFNLRYYYIVLPNDDYYLIFYRIGVWTLIEGHIKWDKTYPPHHLITRPVCPLEILIATGKSPDAWIQGVV